MACVCSNLCRENKFLITSANLETASVGGIWCGVRILPVGEGDRFTVVVFGEECVDGVGQSDHHGFCRNLGL